MSEVGFSSLSQYGGEQVLVTQKISRDIKTRIW